MCAYVCVCACVRACRGAFFSWGWLGKSLRGWYLAAFKHRDATRVARSFFGEARQSEAERTEVLLTPLRDALLLNSSYICDEKTRTRRDGSDRADPV